MDIIKIIRLKQEYRFLLKYKTNYADENIQVIDSRMKYRKTINWLKLSIRTINQKFLKKKKVLVNIIILNNLSWDSYK